MLSFFLITYCLKTHGNYEQKVKELSYSCAYSGPILLYTGEKKLYKALLHSQLGGKLRDFQKPTNSGKYV